MSSFQYHPDILAAFPNVRGGVILARGLRNGPTPDALRQAYHTEQQAILARIGDTPLSEIESLSAWRGAFRAFGVEPTQYRSAAEAQHAGGQVDAQAAVDDLLRLLRDYAGGVFTSGVLGQERPAISE